MNNDRRLSSPGQVLGLAFLLASQALQAGFSGTDVIIPAVARADGAQGAKFYSTVWLTNLSGQAVTYHIQFYETDISNPAPKTVDGTLIVGETKRIEDVVGTTFGLPGKSGALRITATGELLASSRTYSLPESGRLDESVGLFFGAVPASLAIGQGETAALQGVSHNAAENLRYNFGYVETTGQSARVRFRLLGPAGVQMAFLEYDVLPFSRKQFATSAFGDLATSNGRIEASVISGTGKVLVYGTQITNASNDSAGFEMSFKSSLLGAAGVSSLNGLSGALTLAAGNNVTITPSGSTLTISASGSGGSGLSLPFNGTASNPDNWAFRATNIAASGYGIWGSGGYGVVGTSPSGMGVVGLGGGLSGGFPLSKSGVLGVTESTDAGVSGLNKGAGPGVRGESTTGRGVYGFGPTQGVYGESSGVAGAAGVYGVATATSGSFPAGVYGESKSTGGIGVWGRSLTATGNTYGVAGETQSPTGIGVQGYATAGGRGVYGASGSTTVAGIGVRGFTAGPEVGTGVGMANSAGVYGEADNDTKSVSGVFGVVHSSSLYASGVFGYSVSATGNAGAFYNQTGSIYVRVGVESTGKDYAVLAPSSEIYCSKLTATTKSFIQPHPQDASKQIEYVSVEAPTSDVYFRGSGRLRNGIAGIAIPEHFRLVARAGSYMTTVTAVGAAGGLYVAQEDETGIVVRGAGDASFHYVVWAERDMYRDHEPIQPNVYFRPETLDPIALGSAPEELKALLVKNGTLEADGTYNKTRAAQLGWKLPEPAGSDR